jgi:hypothetical protein
MRILIDECVDPRVKLLFPDQDCETVHDRGWDALEDRRLIELAQDEFDVFLTADRSLEFQQNIPKFSIGIVVVHVPKNQVGFFQVLKAELLQAVEQSHPGTVIHVGSHAR